MAARKEKKQFIDRDEQVESFGMSLTVPSHELENVLVCLKYVSNMSRLSTNLKRSGRQSG